MSKIKTNPSQIKDCIAAVKNSDISDSKKDTVITVLKQYTQDKQDGVYTDGVIKQKLFDLSVYLRFDEPIYTNKEVADILLDIVYNLDKRKYF